MAIALAVPSQPTNALHNLRVTLANELVVKWLQLPIIMWGYLGAVVLSFGSIKSAMLGRVPDGMVTLMWLGTGLVLFQLQKTWRAMRATPPTQVRRRTATFLWFVLRVPVVGPKERMRFIFGNVVLMLAGNLTADILLLVALLQERIQLSFVDRFNVTVSLWAVTAVVAGDWAYDKYRMLYSRRRLVTVEDLKFRATLAVCITALFTRIWPGMMFVFSGTLHMLPFSMPMGYLIISLQRCTMTGLEYNRIALKYRNQPNYATKLVHRELRWLMWTDALNAQTAILLFGSCCLAWWVLF